MTWVWSLGREDPLQRTWQLTPVFLPGESHGQRSLVGYSPWGCKETRLKTLSMHTHVCVCVCLCVCPKSKWRCLCTCKCSYRHAHVCRSSAWPQTRSHAFFFWLEVCVCVPSPSPREGVCIRADAHTGISRCAGAVPHQGQGHIPSFSDLGHLPATILCIKPLPWVQLKPFP